MTTMTQMTASAPTTETEIVGAEPDGHGGWIYYDQQGNVVGLGENKHRLLNKAIGYYVEERKKKGGGSATMDTPKVNNHQSGVPNIRWNSHAERWTIRVQRHGKQQFLGLLADLEQAKALQREAEDLPDAALPALKAKYGIRVQRRQKPKQAAPTATAAAPILGDDPAALLEAAERADADAVVAQEAAERANQTALEAMQRATTLWARLAAVLRVRHQGSQAFRESPLAAPNGWAEQEE